MKPSKSWVLGSLVALGIVIGWSIDNFVNASGNPLPALPWASAPLLLVSSALIYLVARSIARKMNEGVKRAQLPHPVLLGRLVILAKATSHGASIAFGLYLGFLLYVAPEWGKSFGQSQIFSIAADALSSALLIAAGLFLENVLKLPPENTGLNV